MSNDEGEKDRVRIQLPVGGIAVLALGPGTSITQPAVMSLTRSGTTIVFSGNGGFNAYAAATPITSSHRWAIAQAHLIADEDATTAATVLLYKRQLGLGILPGSTVNSMRGIEGRTIRDLYKQLARKHKIQGFKRDTASDDPVNNGLNMGNAIMYGCAAAACTSIGLSLSLGIIHRGNSRSLIFDLADLYKPSVTIPIAFQSIGDEDPMASVRRSVRSAIPQEHPGRNAGCAHGGTDALSPLRDDDRIISADGEVSGHTNYSESS